MDELLLNVADVTLSMAVLVFLVFAFMRGDLLSRKSLDEVIAKTVQNVLKELEDRF